MTAPQPLYHATSPSYQHASLEEYTLFIRGYLGDSTAVPHYLQIRREFVEAYPDLQAWFEAPLAERVGRLRHQPRSHFFGRVSYRARPYLYFLALHGYVTFDWEWLISVPTIHIWELFNAVGAPADVER